MPRLERTTAIRAHLDVCFDCSRDLDLHRRSMSHTHETVVSGVGTGFIELNEEVTWEARHFGIRHRHTSRITAFDRPRHFRDEMVRGRYRRFVHDHDFEWAREETIMRDGRGRSLDPAAG